MVVTQRWQEELFHPGVYVFVYLCINLTVLAYIFNHSEVQNAALHLIQFLHFPFLPHNFHYFLMTTRNRLGTDSKKCHFCVCSQLRKSICSFCALITDTGVINVSAEMTELQTQHHLSASSGVISSTRSRRSPRLTQWRDGRAQLYIWTT